MHGVPQDPLAADMVQTQTHRNTVDFPMELYLAPGLPSKYHQIIRSAITAWTEATLGVVQINLVCDWVPEVPFEPYQYMDFEKKTLWFLPPNNEHLLRMYVEVGHFFDGIAHGDFVVVPMDGALVNGGGLIDSKALDIIVRHEIGHLLGLEHLKPQYRGLMNSGGNGGVITRNDLIQFCHLYECSDGVL
jgi:hypothetical protein